MGAPQKQSNLVEGRFWEQGMFAVAPKIATVPAIPEKLNTGLNIMRDFMHSKGIIFGNEPGSILVKPLQNVVNAVMFGNDMPFRWSFIMADSKTLCDKYKENAKVFEEARKLDEWYYGKTSLTKNHIKLFADILKRKNQKYLYKVSLVNQIGFKDVNNKVKRLKDYEGKWVHIDIWATWCKTCKIEYSFLKKLEEHFTAKQEVQIIFISTDRKFDHCKNHLLENKLEGVQLYSGENSEFVKFFVKFYDIGALVRFIMLDKEGKIMSPDEIRPSNPELLPKLVSIVSSKKSNIVSKVKIGY